MKKTLLSLTLASLFPLAAVADVIVYGKANVALQNADEANDSKIELVSNASRIGIKGGEEVNSSLKIIYQFEYQTEVDDGNGSNNQTFAPRNIYLGLQGTAGTLMGGHFDTPTKVIQEKVDLFNDLEGDITSIFKGEIRASNIVQYTTPTFGGGFAASVAYVSEEKDGVFNQTSSSQCPITPATQCTSTDGASFSFSYTSPMFYAAIAADKDVEYEGVDLIRAVARLTVGAFQFGLLGESYENDNNGADEDGVMVSALWNVTDKWAVKAQHGSSDVKWIDGESSSVGVDYKMTKNATLYGYYTMVENGLPRLINTPPVTNTNYRDDNYVGVGLDFKF
jgi:predicted porin